MKDLTHKQAAFVACYNGNGVEAARLAGYRGNDATLRAIASENLTKPNVAQAIRGRENTEQRQGILNRLQRQAFWSGIMSDTSLATADRLRASELLAKSEGDFKQPPVHIGATATIAVYMPDNGRGSA